MCIDINKKCVFIWKLISSEEYMYFVYWKMVPPAILRQDVFVKHYDPAGNKVQKSCFKLKGHSQCHKVINLSLIQKDISSGVCIPNMKSLSITVQKL